MEKLAIVALWYLEPEFQQTLECLQKLNYPVFYADRDGVGNMSRAFNEAFKKYVEGRFEYVWFVTNITFTPDVPDLLLDAMENGVAIHGIHPAMAGSDHQHLWPGELKDVQNVPFIELTAPMFRTDVFSKFMLCIETPYYYMDLIISHQIRKAGGQVAVHKGCEVGHTYLRNNKTAHPISEIRKRLRNYWTPLSKAYMEKTYGDDWTVEMWPR